MREFDLRIVPQALSLPVFGRHRRAISRSHNLGLPVKEATLAVLEIAAAVLHRSEVVAVFALVCH